MSSDLPPTPIPEAIVSRTADEHYVLNIWILSAESTPTSRYYTYTRQEGLYKLSPNDNAPFVTLLDEVLDEQYQDYGSFDESVPTRTPGDAYELLVTITDEDVRPYDASFSRNKSIVYLTPTAQSDHVTRLDEAFASLHPSP